MRAGMLSVLAFMATLASAHFQILYPPQGIPFSEDEEATGPCGGPDPEVSDSTSDVQVDQFAISIRSSHPEGHWSFRYTTSTAPPYNFTGISNIETSGVGDFCLTTFSVPSELAGSSGIIQIVDNAEDGELYQCTPVNFVEGANSTVGSACTNSSSAFTASYGASGSSDSGHSHGTMSMSGSMSMSSGASATAGGASSSSSPGAAAMATGVGALAGLGMVVAGLAL